MNSLLIILAVGILILCGIVMIRNDLVLKHTLRAIDEIYDHPDWQEAKKMLGGENQYLWDILDIRKWTYKQFFPELGEKQ